jgi:Holliday junction resolvase
MKGTTYGACDLVALKAGERPMVIEVKSTAGSAYKTFGPTARTALLEVAKLAGAVAVLAWWPPRGKLILIDETVWP